MKRTPLKRKTPLKRVSKKRAMLNALMNPGRTGFVLLAGRCMVCGDADAIDCHEVCRGSAREACLHQPRLWLALCRPCHELMDDYSTFPIVKQLAIRIRWEIKKTIQEANQVRGRAPGAITAAEVIECLSNMKG